MKNIAIIPARSGSKGLKDKNIKKICGYPLMYYSIDAALKSDIFSCVHVSTDNEQYQQIAISLGAEAPMLRPIELGEDTADVWEVVKWIIDYYKDMGNNFDMITLLQPTSPLRDYKDIVQAYSLFLNKNADSIISVCENEHPSMLCNTLNASLSMCNFVEMKNAKRRQEFEIEYRLNGAIYMIKEKLLYNNFNLYNENSYAYIMSNDKSIDIDCGLDFFLAEKLLEKSIDHQVKC